MWWSAWSRHQTLIPVEPSRRRNSHARHNASSRLMASSCFHHDEAAAAFRGSTDVHPLHRGEAYFTSRCVHWID